MRRWAKWISSLAMGVLLACQAWSVEAQLSHNDQPTLAGGVLPGTPNSDDRGSDSDYATSDETNDQSAPVDGRPTRDWQYSSPGNDESLRNETTGEAGEDGGEKTEIIKERYPDGSVKIERETTQDSSGNYLNHGSWKMWDQRGNLLAQGDYRYGNRTGTWIRWYRSASEVPLLTRPPYQQYPAPFISQATFENGQLNGYWTIYDGKTRKISQWRFVDGRRNGPSIWWHANGRKMREIEFRNGDIDGQLIEWGPEGAVLLKETYQAGRKLAQKTSQYPGPNGAKKTEGMYLFAKDVEKTPDDWWNGKLLATSKTGKDEKHGAWTAWHANGQRQMEGTYEHDLQVGLFTWWHANGQKALEGRYHDGKQDGGWTWWYTSGQKSIQGYYAHGNPTGRWTWWNEDGKVAQSADLSQSEGVVIQQLPGDIPKVLPQAKKPAPRQGVRR